MIYKGKSDVYSCYSPRLHDFLEENGICNFDEFTNIHTHKKCWVYDVNNDLGRLLTLWSNSKTNYVPNRD